MALAHPVNRIIIQEYLHKGWDVLTEYFRNDPLERCRRGFQPEHHNHCDEYTRFRYECFLFLIFGMHADLVISADAVQKTIHRMPHDSVQHTVCKRYGENVCDYHGVKFSIINVDPNFLVFLGDEDYGAEPCRPFYWSRMNPILNNLSISSFTRVA